MNSPLRKGEGSAPKSGWLVLCVPLGLALLGFLNQRNVVAFPVITPWAKAAGLFVAIVGVWVIARNRHPAIKLNHYGLLKRFATLALMFMVIGMFGYIAVLLGVPTIWSKVALTPRSGEATVTYILKERAGKGCHWRIEVDGGPLPEAMTPCVSKALWASLRTGDPVSVTYTQSAFAFVIEDIQHAK